jgi:hypothetical protein
MDTFNLYMDELPAGMNGDDESGLEIQFRVVPNSSDDGDPENNAVLAGLDMFDLIELRDAVQEVVDAVALATLEFAADSELEEERMP